MPISRRNAIIRTVGTLCGDLTVGFAVASVALWVIEAAALGLFLSFLTWLIGALLALAFSQFVLHPAMTVVLSDRKLDLAVNAVTGLADQATQMGRQLWRSVMPA